MSKIYTGLILKFSGKKTSKLYKLCFLFISSIFFSILLPALFVYIGRKIDRYIQFEFPDILEMVVIIISLLVGLFFVIWATITLWKIGKGTPNPIAPTNTLVITGPYKLCRNPIQLGGILYYMGIVALFGTLTSGLIFFLLGLIIGSIYNRYFEEKELEERFGNEYTEYKRKTPFLIPRLFSLKRK